MAGGRAEEDDVEVILNHDHNGVKMTFEDELGW